ncbi:MAG: NAD(P)-dependent oxidoreductase [Hyphomicrobium sp.]|nr:NAD(P)-dependent oxidoreductase [Hyphomicrobium sp.]PPC81847.1 MAG: 3-hydroxyisobutyrate dehydrogenase [Hyphomicrobium sp.]
MTRIAFLGLGAMGSRMAQALVRAGHAVTAWNRDPAKAQLLASAGATIAGSPRAAAADADIVIAMVRDDEASRHVWLDTNTGALAGMKRDAIAIDCSTLTIGWVRELAEAAKEHGIALLDAPVAGSRPQADAGQLIFMVGGDAARLAYAEPVLKAMGGAVHHAGANGTGATVKLAVNALFAIQVSAMAELIGLLKQSSVDAARAVEIIGMTPVASTAVKGAAASMLAGNFAPMFPVELVEKDLGYVLAAAAGYGSAAPMTEAAYSVMGWAMDAGFGYDNLTGIGRLFDPPRGKRGAVQNHPVGASHPR